MRIRTIGLLVSAGLAAAMPACAHAQQPTAFTDIDVVDVATGRLIEDRTVLVEDGRIVAIGDGSNPLPDGAAVIAGTGLYLAPGLADMHTHTWYEQVQLPLALTFGVTTIREMSGNQATLDARAAITSGDMLGPRIITAGPIVDGDPPVWPGSAMLTDPAMADQLVAEQAAAGYDFIKPYDRLTREAFAALAEAAHRHGLPIAGHVPNRVPIDEAIAAGMTSIEHISATWEKEALRPEVDRAMMNWQQERIDLGNRVAVGELSLDEIYDWDQLRAIARRVAQAGVAVTPTLALDHRYLQTAAERAESMALPEMRFASPAMRNSWVAFELSDAMGWDDDAILALRALVFAEDAIVQILHEEGVLLLAGTDTANAFMVHGWSLNDELVALRDAGLSDAEAIRTATLNPARYLGEEGEWGEVRPGARADLVLLAANPLEDVANYRQIAGVMVAGRWLDAATIAQMQGEGQAAYAAIPVEEP
ncbi:MAG: amidohydrolase family protein [Erythrobacter sp.]|nr:amidohydrolase family protein [Erythrobacter sp.]